MSSHPFHLASLAELRARIRALEGTGPGTERHRLSFGAPEIDRALPWGGLPLGCLHEVAGEGAASGFCAALLARLAGERGVVLWCLRVGAHQTGELYAPGLAAFGLDPERLIVLRGRGDAEVLWAVQEGLRSGKLAAAVGEVRKVALSDGRRLQLAAEAGCVTGILLRSPHAKAGASAAVTCWRLSAAPSASSLGEVGVGRPRWRAELLRCRGAEPRSWLVEWRHETGDFAVVVLPSDRSAEPDTPARGGRVAL